MRTVVGQRGPPDCRHKPAPVLPLSSDFYLLSSLSICTWRLGTSHWAGIGISLSYIWRLNCGCNSAWSDPNWYHSSRDLYRKKCKFVQHSTSKAQRLPHQVVTVTVLSSKVAHLKRHSSFRQCWLWCGNHPNRLSFLWTCCSVISCALYPLGLFAASRWVFPPHRRIQALTDVT